ncbi:MAG: class I SAM-dependent methyltransferase [Dehalococcoidia bacterium]
MQYQDAAIRLRPTAAEAFEAYTALVAANREQVERLRDVPEPEGDFWARRAPRFRPGVLDVEELPGLLELARPDDTWLDIGAGGGRFAIPISRHVRRVVAVEPSPSMRGTLAESIAAAGRDNLDVVDLRWPPEAGAEVPRGDVALVANVLYDCLVLEEFLAALEAHVSRLCVVIASDRAPSTPDPGVWEALHGEPLCPLPGLPEFVAVLGAMRRRYEVRAFGMSSAPAPMTPDEALADSRWRYWVEPGSPADASLSLLLVERFGLPDGSVQLPPRRNYSAVVSWEPPRERA